LYFIDWTGRLFLNRLTNSTYSNRPTGSQLINQFLCFLKLKFDLLSTSLLKLDFFITSNTSLILIKTSYLSGFVNISTTWSYIFTYLTSTFFLQYNPIGNEILCQYTYFYHEILDFLPMQWLISCSYKF